MKTSTDTKNISVSLSSMADISILVLGAGELGIQVLRSLARKVANLHSETSISVLLRPSTINSQDPIKHKEVEGIRLLGINLVAGDIALNSVQELASIFSQFHTVISCTGFVGGRGTQEKITHAVLESNAKRFFPWQFGVDYDVIGRGSAQDLFDEQLEVRDLLRSQHRLDHFIVSTGMFTSFLFESFFGVVDLSQNVVRALGSWKKAVTVTTAEDIGILTAEIALHTSNIPSGSVVYTAGDTVTYKQLADIVDSVLGVTVTRELWTIEHLQTELNADPTNEIKKYRVVFAEGRGVSWNKNVSFNVEKGIPTVGVEQWMCENLLSAKDK